MTQTDFRNQVDNLMNILWGAGVASHATIIEQINYLVFLRSLSKKDDNAMKLDPSAEMIFSGELKKYHWDNLLIFNADELFNTLEDIFRKLPEITTDQTIKLLFRDAHVKIFDKPTLRRLVHEIEKMFSDLEKQSTSGHTDIFGDMYEYLLSKLSQAGTLGSFRTPRHIIKFMVDVIDPKKGETILDPACGTAGFLVAALKHLEEKYTSDDYKKIDKYPMDLLSPNEREFVYRHTFTGFDSDFDMFKFGLMNLYLHKLEHPNIKRQNTLVDTAGDRTKWDVILANPPFSGALDIDSISEDLRMGTRSTEILFLRYMIDHLSVSGRAGVIVPEGVVFNSTNAHKKIRQMLVEDAGLWCVVSLPGGIFNPYAGVKTSILFFDKSLKNKVKDILFVKVENDGFDLGATKRPIDKDDLPDALNWINGYKELLLKPLAPGLKPALLDHGPKSEANLVPISKISESGDYSLNGDKYKDNVIYTQGDYPLIELEKICTFEYGKPLKESNRIAGDYPVYGSAGVVGFHNEFIVKKPFIVVGRKGSAGDITYSEYNGYPIDTTFYIKLENEEKILLRFLYWMLLHLNLGKVKIQAGVPGLNRNDAYKQKIPLPPIGVQKQIVEELDGCQRIIDGAKQIIESWKPSFNINPTWKKIKLGDVATIQRGRFSFRPRNAPHLYGGEYPFIQTGDIVKAKNGAIPYTQTLNEEGLKTSKQFDPGAVIMTIAANIGDTAILDYKACFPDSLVAIRPKNDQIDLCFLKLILETKKQHLNDIAPKAAQKNINIQILEPLEIELPSIKEQKEIVDEIEKEKVTIDSLRKLIKLYQEKINQKIEEVWGE